ncbi:hypothetical protein J2W59_005899 [Pseudomonas fluorescens]|nr:hypothetical protein [Pseudomonas fluorescens]
MCLVSLNSAASKTNKALPVGDDPLWASLLAMAV